MIGKRFSILALIVIMTMLLASCGGGEATPTTQAPAEAPTAATAESPTAMTGEAPTAMTVETPTQASMVGETPTEVMTGTTPAAGGAMTGTTMTKDVAPPVPNPNKTYSG